VQARLLTLILLSFFGVGLFGGVVTPWWPAFDFLAVVISNTLAVPAAVALFAVLATLYGRPLTRVRRLLTALSIGLATLSAAGNILLYVVEFLTTSPFASLFVFQTFALGFASVVSLVCAVLAVAASKGADRQQVAWITASIGPYVLVFALASFAWPAALGNTQLTTVLTILLNAFSITMPIGLTYAILARRSVDVGYLLNRAAIFGIMSVFVLGVFILVEWALSAWISNASHTTSILIALAVALGLGLSIRFVHRRIEHFIDQVFFRKRYDDETAMRRFAREAAFINDADSLLDRTVKVVTEHTEASSVKLLALNGDASFAVIRGDAAGLVDPNDPAIVALKTWNEPVDLYRYETALKGDLAFPMTARGQLYGVLVCGSNRSGEAYAPDESEALERVAQGVGSALDTLSLNSGDPAQKLERVVERLSIVVDKITQAFESGPNHR
jgi:hypothetical protein